MHDKIKRHYLMLEQMNIKRGKFSFLTLLNMQDNILRFYYKQ